MSAELAVYFAQTALWTAMLLAGPLLLTALIVGGLVSVIQAVTQVQEITLVFVPKILAVFAVMALMGGWMLQIAVAYGTQMFQSIGTGV